jgi:hypothetical protein
MGWHSAHTRRDSDNHQFAEAVSVNVVTGFVRLRTAVRGLSFAPPSSSASVQPPFWVVRPLFWGAKRLVNPLLSIIWPNRNIAARFLHQRTLLHRLESVRHDKESPVKKAAVATAAMLALLSIAGCAQDYVGKGKAPPPPVITKG